jgi:hypothetical protein
MKRNQKTEIANDNYQFVLHPIRFVNKTRASNTQFALLAWSANVTAARDTPQCTAEIIATE